MALTTSEWEHVNWLRDRVKTLLTLSRAGHITVPPDVSLGVVGNIKMAIEIDREQILELLYKHWRTM